MFKIPKSGIKFANMWRRPSNEMEEVDYAEFDEELTKKTAEKHRKLLESVGRL